MSATYEELLEAYLAEHPYPPLGDEQLDEQLNYLAEAKADDSDPERTAGAYGCQRGTSQPEHVWRSFHLDMVRGMEPAKWTHSRHGGTGEPAFSYEDVRAIRETYAAGVLTQRQIAAAYGVTYQTIGGMVRGETYVNYGGPITVRGLGQWPPNRRTA